MVIHDQLKPKQVQTTAWLSRHLISTDLSNKFAEHDLQQQHDRQAAVADLTLAIAKPHELPLLLAKIVQLVRRLLPAADASVVLWDSDLKQFVTSASTVISQKPQETATKVRRQSGATKWIIDNSQPVIIEDISLDPFGANRMLTDYGYAAYCGVPLISDQGAIGVLYALEVSPRQFSNDDVNYMITLANHITIAIENARLFQALTDGLRLTDGLYTIARAPTDTPISELAITIGNVVSEVCKADKVIFSLWDSHSEEVIVNIQVGDAINFKDLVDSIDPRAGLFGLAIRSKQCVISARNVVDDRHSPALQKWRRDSGIGAIAFMPLVQNEVVFGVLTTINHADSADFDSEHISKLEKLATQAASALSNNILLQKIRNQTEDLEQQVHERTVELRAANSRLEKADRLKSKFISDISHELRTPVTSISIYLDLLSRGPSEKFERYLGTLLKEKDRLVDILEKVMFMTTLSDRINAECGDCDLNLLIQAVVSELQLQKMFEKAQISTQLLNSLPQIAMPIGMARQVIFQLMLNALQFSGADEIMVETKVDEASEFVVTTVKDKGPGIPGEELPNIFDRFYRGNAVGQYNIISGSGLGLSMVYEIMTGYSGSVAVESIVGEGTTFTLLFPVAHK